MCLLVEVISMKLEACGKGDVGLIDARNVAALDSLHCRLTSSGLNLGLWRDMQQQLVYDSILHTQSCLELMHFHVVRARLGVPVHLPGVGGRETSTTSLLERDIDLMFRLREELIA